MSHHVALPSVPSFPRARAAAAAAALAIGVAAAACAAPPTAPKQPTTLRADGGTPPIPQDTTFSGYQNPGGK